MNEEQKGPKGILLGVVENGDGETYIGVSIAGMAMAAVTVSYAGLLFNQLGDLLDTLGYFDDEVAPEGEAKCRTH